LFSIKVSQINWVKQVELKVWIPFNNFLKQRKNFQIEINHTKKTKSKITKPITTLRLLQKLWTNHFYYPNLLTESYLQLRLAKKSKKPTKMNLSVDLDWFTEVKIWQKCCINWSNKKIILMIRVIKTLNQSFY